MPPVAALLDRKAAVASLRRALPRRTFPVYTARSADHLVALLYRHQIDAVVVGAEAIRAGTFDALRRDFGAMPFVLYLPLRSDDADLVRHAQRERVAAMAIESLDEPVLARLIAAAGLAQRRLDALVPLAAAVDLADPIQQMAWPRIIVDAPAGLPTARLARTLNVRRETLSRRFGAGAAPSLKRAIDAVRLIAAAQLLGNAAFSVRDVARLLGFSSASSLQATARRTLGVSAKRVATLSAGAIATRLRSPSLPHWE